MIEERDVRIPMRDGVRLALDIDQRARVLSPLSMRSRCTTRTCKGLTWPTSCPRSPRMLPLWFGPIEAGDT